MEKNIADTPTSERPVQDTSKSIEHDNLGKIDAITDNESKSREVTLSNDIEVDKGEMRDEGKSFDLKPEEERKEASGENYGDSIEHNHLADMDASMDLDLKSLRGTLSNGIEQVDQGEKVGSKSEEEIRHSTRENLGEEESDSVFDGTDMPGLEANMSTSLHSSGDDALMEKNIMEVTNKEVSVEKNVTDTPTSERPWQDTACVLKDDPVKLFEEIKTVEISNCDSELDKDYSGGNIDDSSLSESKCHIEKCGDRDTSMDHESKSSPNLEVTLGSDIEQVDHGGKMDDGKTFESKPVKEIKQATRENSDEVSDPVVNAAVVPEQEANRSKSLHSLGTDDGTEGSVRREKSAALKNIVKGKGIVAVSAFLRAFSGKLNSDENKEFSYSFNDREVARASPRIGDRSAWNPLSYIMVSRNAGAGKTDQGSDFRAEAGEPTVMKGRIILYTRLGCQSCKEVRSFLNNRRLRYVEINIDVYPGRTQELEKFTGSSVVPKVFFNEIVIGGLSELKSLDESGKLEEKIDFLITEEPAYEAPLPPLSGEDDMSSSGTVDELALIVRKMKESVVVKDRFYKMRRFSKCFLGSEAVNFLSENQKLEKEEAIEFGRKLASKLLFQHVLDENLFEDGNHLYWFLDDNPFLSSQCHNIPRGIIETKPMPVREIALRLRFLSNAIYEAYTSEDGKHVDYRAIHGSEEFARYLRIIQELQRIDFQDIPREEKLAFFINLFNTMTIHAILVLDHPVGAAEWRKFLGDFKYVIGGCPYSLLAIQNGILRCNQQPPFVVIKPFGIDRFSKAALPYPEPLIHFALCLGTRSGPALRCYSPGNIDKELMDSARHFLRGGGLTVDLDAKVAYLNKILKWFSVDFGENEIEVLKHASNYLEPANSEALLELLQDGQLKVVYQPYDWGLNL